MDPNTRALIMGAAGAAAKTYVDVFSTWLYTGNGSTQTITNGIDLAGKGGLTWIKGRNVATDHQLFDTARGATKELISNSTAAEAVDADTLTAFNGDGFSLDADSNTNTNAATYASWTFRRAPGFFDVVCYSGTGSAKSVPHNLGAVPELVIWKERSTSSNWYVYQGTANSRTYGRLNTTVNFAGNTPGWFSSVTSTQIGVCASSDNTDVNDNGVTYVQYLFATVAGVSKVGLYTGTGTTQTINCGFTAGSRFILIKRLDDAGDWYVWDTARGIVSGNDPYLLLNSLAAEVTSTDYIDPLSSGFQISSTAPAAINNNGGSFIFLAVA